MVVGQLYAVCHLTYLVLRDESGLLQQIYVFLIFAALVLLTLGISRRPAFSLGVPALLIIAIQQLSFAKYEYLRAPVLIDDLFLLFKPEVGDLLLHGYPQLAWVFFAALGASVAYLLAALALEAPWPMRNRRWLPVSAVIAALAWLAIVIPGPGPLAVATAETTDPASANSDWDVISRFFASVLHTGVKRPVFATPKAPWVAVGPAAMPVAAGAGRPDIVVVLQETTFNPQTVLPFCTPAICERPMLTGLPNSAAVGPLRVHVAGGLTWLSEFALFTGMPHSLFGQAGQYATARILPRVKYTLPRWLKAQGYRTVVIYPVDKGTWGATVAYPKYGFDEVVTHPLVASGQRQGYWDLTDRELYDVVQQRIAAEDQKSDRAPLFIFMLTAQQHGPHGDHLKGQPHRDDSAT
ncbi:MAG TPA: sulfatase-like hydrolase/transferase, partial [Vineibacter sp.]|nr:sulfatase-like hydrolase/transferase [Vineibacter sp.]